MTYPIPIKPEKNNEIYCLPDNIIPPPLFSPPDPKNLEKIVNEFVEKQLSIKDYYKNK